MEIKGYDLNKKYFTDKFVNDLYYRLVCWHGKWKWQAITEEYLYKCWSQRND